MNIKRLDDPTVPVASTLVGLIIYGMQGGQTVKVTPTLLEGSDGVDGINGKSAYQVAVDNGFVGTQAEWLESLIGNSAYEDWLESGKTGTFQDFLDEIVEAVNLALPQTLTEAQKAQVRENIDALASSVINEELGKKADHGYTAEETPKTLKEVDDEVSQLAGEVSVKLNNLTTNGNFANGATGWTSATSTLTVTDGELTVKSTRTSSGPVYVAQSNQIIGNNIYYVSFKYRSEIAPIRLSNNDNFPYDLLPTVAILTPYSIVLNNINNTSGLRFRIDDVSPFGNEFSIKDVLLINLTTAFGVGNEPTKSEMDLLISIMGVDYFEGEVTIPAQKVMQWQLKMIRQNRSAIIALGGTII